ncbi:putative bifunctional diguanylate cyclase/phosphodiesterase [Vreelandella salicampi]|uniref:cyclic-guanylate-specific phosphodiesterase n=1 Tax=Vreelandella salicampi TaxID=1449798 RepID=A0A7Z0RUD6_9GAMM|nr:GGDEF domain-containing phosphodiesterase [Halomonas salicampi]NYS60457.1 EAL domain-containing protein [Halomonas salicampi]
MKPTQSLLMVFLLPMLIIIVPTAALGLAALHGFKHQSAENHAMQRADLQTLTQMATFERELSELHQRVSSVLNDANQGELNSRERYVEYGTITEQLSALSHRVDTLTQSPLITDLYPQNAAALKAAFQEYQRFIEMANEATTLNQKEVMVYLREAQSNFNRFVMLTQHVLTGLTQRASERNDLAFGNLGRSLSSSVFASIGILSLLIIAAVFAAWRMNKRLMLVGDAILELSNPRQTLPALSAIERISHRQSGPLKRLADALLTFRDNERQRRDAEKKVHQLAYYDTLTDLPNWRLLREHLQHSIETNHKTQTFGALIYIDVDMFKRINDSSGHRAGDSILRQIAERLTQLAEECFTLGRLGGDEFAVIIDGLAEEHVPAAEKAEQVAEQIRQALGEPYRLDDNVEFISASQGIALFHRGDEDINALFQYANAAAHVAKKSGPGSIRFYDPAIQAEIEERTVLERDLRFAIEREEFVLVYQMQVDNHGHPIGAEALIRWQHPRNGFVSPGKFIPLAEESGMIIPIGGWVLKAACKQLVAWQADAHTAELVLAVNVSAKQFQQPGFVEEVATVLTQTGAPAHKLKLELTESTVLGKVEETIARMHKLKALGVSFAMDDFGTGYSSLQYLKRLPLDQLKIDQSFVRDLHQDPEDKAIVQTIIAMGRALHLNIIAEGVETQAHWRYLSEHQCHAYQGYYFCKPVSAVEMAQTCLAPPALA